MGPSSKKPSFTVRNSTFFRFMKIFDLGNQIFFNEFQFILIKIMRWGDFI